jgi:hypothetical protein
MHDDDNRLQRFVPVLRRVIILLAVLAATPVVLWMITAFVRAYVGPPRVPALHQIAATAPTVSATAAASTPSPDQATAAPAQGRIADITASTTDVTATTTSDVRDVPLPKGSLLADRPSDGASAGLSTMAPASIPSPSQASAAFATPTNLTTAMTSAGGAPQILQQPPASAATAEASRPTAVAEQSPDILPPAPPLTGKIPLPRHRPPGLGDADMTRMAQGAVPVPRPRPDAAGPASPPETASPGPLEFLQNIFHQ